MNHFLLNFNLPAYYLSLAPIVAQVDPSSSLSSSEELDAATTLNAVTTLILVVLVLALYIFGAICLQKILERLRIKDSWLAWVPIANLVKTLEAGDMNPWFVLLFFIPGVGGIINLVMTIMAYKVIAVKLGRPEWIAYLIIIPLAAFWVMYTLAFSTQVG
jgi:hypothetical protein